MSTAADFEAFWNWHLAIETDMDVTELWKALEARFPSDADRRGYFKWTEERKAREKTTVTPISRNDLKEMIANMNYNSAIDRSKLVSAVEQEVVPWIPVGNDRDGDIYRIVPGAYGLRSDQPKPKTGGLELVSDNVLGVNTNVQTRNPVGRREANLSEESTQSNNSDDSDVGGFVFHQIGTLEYWGDEPENFQNMEDAARGPWLETGFCVAMRFTRSGGANGLYIIYDFYPEAQDGTSRRVDRRYEHIIWGYLPSGKRQFSIAKIADKITDLRFGRTFDLTEVVEHPVELVRCLKTQQQTVIRATIA